MYEAIKHSNNRYMWLVVNKETNKLHSIENTRKEARYVAQMLNEGKIQEVLP